MIDPQHLVDNTVEEAKAYAAYQTEYWKLLLIEHLSKIGGAMLWRLAVLVFGSAAALFGFIALAMALGEWMDSYALGFMTSGGGMLLVLLALYLFRNRLFEQALLRKLTKIIPLTDFSEQAWTPSTTPQQPLMAEQQVSERVLTSVGSVS